MKGLILSAPSSGGGKTTVTLGLLRALSQRGNPVRSAKSGPDYIDPRFHESANGIDCINLDAWAMSPMRIKGLAAGETPLLIEGAMGLFDAAPDGKGSTADLALILGLPVVLILDVSKQAQSVAALVLGFIAHDPRVRIAGLILNKVGSDKHERMLRSALKDISIPVLGVIRRDAKLATPSRHLGLVQAQERDDLEAFLTYAGHTVASSFDLDAFLAIAEELPTAQESKPFAPPAQSIAIAKDVAFAFMYPHLLQDWRNAGAELSFFSPMNDEAPDPNADLVFLPGGYPELHASKLAAANTFKAGIRKASAVYGECGGYMVMGDGLIDAVGKTHEMLGLLSLETSFAKRRLHLGYRNLTPLGGLWNKPLKAHEFHYASTIKAEGQALFRAIDAEGTELPEMGQINGRYSGSFAHIIDQA